MGLSVLSRGVLRNVCLEMAAVGLLAASVVLVLGALLGGKVCNYPYMNVVFLGAQLICKRF